MLRLTATSLRYRTAWRELLHPLPPKARRVEWLKRDAVEQNEALLRRPYYTLKSYSLPPAVGQQTQRSAGDLRTYATSSDSIDEILRQPRRVASPERLQELREQLQFPGAVGPQPAMDSAAESYAEAYGSRLRPRYPESWDTVPPHQPSREMLALKLGWLQCVCLSLCGASRLQETNKRAVSCFRRHITEKRKKYSLTIISSPSQETVCVDWIGINHIKYMTLSLRDVMTRPSDAEAMALLRNEYNKWCVGRLDGSSDEDSGDEEDRLNNSYSDSDSDSVYYRLLHVAGAFNVRALSRVEFPRMWIVPLGTIPAGCYANAAVNGGSDTSLLVDYSQTRGVVRMRSELLKPTDDGGLPQKVLAVWPEKRMKSMPPHLIGKHQQQQNQSVLYWPAFVTRIVGVFSDPLLDGSPDSIAKLQSYEEFNDILLIALRTPMRICVDVTFCIDEISEARRLTIAPAVQYPKKKKVNGKCSQRGVIDIEADCPNLVPEVMPEVVSIRNYSHTAVAVKGRRCGYSPTADTVSAVAVLNGHSALQSDRNGMFIEKAAQQRHNGHMSIDRSVSTPTKDSIGCSNGGSGGLLHSKAKLNRNTLSHGPIAVLDMLAGPICQTGQFVFLRPTAKIALKAQREAIMELRVLWERLRRALFQPIRAEEIMLPTLRAEFVQEATVPSVQLPDPNTYVSPYIQKDRTQRERKCMQPPPHANSPHLLTYEGLQRRLPILQCHRTQETRERVSQRRQHQSNVPPPAFECVTDAANRQRSESRSGRSTPSLFRTHDPDSDAGTPCFQRRGRDIHISCNGDSGNGKLNGSPQRRGPRFSHRNGTH